MQKSESLKSPQEDRKTWKGKFSLVSPWFSDIVSTIKQQLKSEHLSLDPSFVRLHFHGLPLHRISQEEMRAVYLREILSGQNGLAEFVANRWLFKNLPLYKFFEEKLEKFGGNIETIEEIADERAEEILNSALAQYSIDDIFCFVTLNEVSFSPTFYLTLHKRALDELSKRNSGVDQESQVSDVERLKVELKRQKDRFEKRLTEQERKHALELTKLHQEIKELKAKVKAAK